MDYNLNFTRKNVDHYVGELDEELCMNGKLKKHFIPEQHWPNFRATDLIGFDAFYDILSAWGIEQKMISYDDFSPDEQPGIKWLHHF